MENQEQNYEAPKNSNDIEEQQIPGDPSETASIDDAGDVDNSGNAQDQDAAPKAGGPPTDNDQAVGQDADYRSQESIEKSLTDGEVPKVDPGKAVAEADDDTEADDQTKADDETEDDGDEEDVEELEEEGEEVTEGENALDNTDTDPGKNANSGIEDITDKEQKEVF